MPIDPQIPLGALAGMTQSQGFDPLVAMARIEQIRAQRGANQDRDALARLREQQIEASQQKMGIDARQADIEAEKTTYQTLQERAKVLPLIAPYAKPIVAYMQQPEGWQEDRTLLRGMASMVGAEALVDRLPEQYSPEAAAMVAQIPAWLGQQVKDTEVFGLLLENTRKELKRDPNNDEVLELVKRHTAAKQAPSAAQGGGKMGTREEYLAKYLRPNYTQEQYDATVKRFEALNDPNQGADVAPLVLTRRPYEEEQNDIIPGGTLTKKAVWENAIEYALTNTIKQNPRSSDPKERTNFNAIENAKAALIKDDASLPQVQALYAALNGGQKQMMKQYLNTSAFVDSAEAGLDLMDEYSKAYPRESVPVVNDIQLWWNRNLKADANLSRLEVFVFNASRDYAKATSGSAGSVQQMTDAQIKASELLLSLRQGPAAFKAAAESMRQDMDNQVNAQRKKLDETNKGILNLLDPAAGKPWLPEGSQLKPTEGTTAGFTAKTTDGRTVNFPSMASRDAAVKESQGLLKADTPASEPAEKVDYIWDPATKKMKKVGG